MFHALFYTVILFNLINLSHLGLYIAGANVYDIKTFIKSSKQSKSKKNQDNLPLVSVVIPAHNEALVIRRTLDSVWASSYRNTEVVVVDDGSTDRTEKIVRDHIKHLPTTITKSYFGSTIYRVYVKRGHYETNQSLKRHYLRLPTTRVRTITIVQSNAGKASAMNNAIGKHVKGEFVMCLDADSVLHPEAIARALVYLQDPQIIGVAANVRVMASKSFIGITQRFEHLIGYRSKKFYSLTNSEFIIGGVASTYRVNALKEVNLYDTDTLTEDIGLSLKLISHGGNLHNRIIYGDDVLAFTEGAHNFKALLRQRYRWKMGSLQNLYKYRHLIGRSDHSKYSYMLTKYRLPMALLSEVMLVLEPLIILYILYISLLAKTPLIILGAYLTITLYVMWTIWPDQYLTLKQKLKMSALSLVIYGLFFIIDIVQIAAIFKCIWNFKKVAKLNIGETWVSPERLGIEAV